MDILKKALYLAVLIVATWAFAAGPPGSGAGGPEGPKALFTILDEDQQETVKAMFEENREEMKGLHEEMESLREKLHELVKTEAGETTLNAKIEEIGALKTEIMKKYVNLRVEIRKLLTDEQKSQLDEMEATMGPGRHKGGPGKGPKHGNGGPGPGADWPEPEGPSE